MGMMGSIPTSAVIVFSRASPVQTIFNGLYGILVSFIAFSAEYSLNSSFSLDSLNPSQREAVVHCDGPTLVLAGAGSGKTRVLTHKIAYLVSQGIQPWRILAVTFTNKAAREMSSRVESLLNIPAQGLWIGTFHGMCVRILRREADRWGIKRDFTIYDRDDQLSILRRALKNLNVKKRK